jgi:nucleoid DNA-binding protein
MENEIKTFSKTDLANKLYENKESYGFVSKAQAHRAVDDTISAILAELEAGNKVSLYGLGTLFAAELAPRKGSINGHEYSVDRRKSVKFDVSNSLKRKLNKA